MIKAISFFPLFVLTLRIGLCQQAIVTDSFHQKMEQFVNSFVSNRSFNGCILVAKGDKIIFQKSYGYADYERKIKNTSHTFFKLASVTKGYTQVAIEYLQKKGLLNMDDPINKYFKDFPRGNRITIQQLIDHKSGISDINDYPTYDSLSALNRDFSSHELYNLVKTLPFSFEPGSSERYSNSNYILLAYLIEVVSGKTYETFLKENILKPLHIYNTFIDHANKRSALGYTADVNSNGFRKLSGWNSSLKLGSGCLSATIDDVYKFLKNLIHDSIADISSKSKYENLINLQGNGNGVCTMARYQKDIDLYTIVLSNNWAEAAWSLAREVSNIYLNKPYTIWKQQPVKMPVSDYESLTGVYKAPHWSFKFYVKDSKPVISGIRYDGTINYNRTYVVIPLGNNEFFFPFFWAKIALLKIDGEPIVRWTDIK